MRRQPTPTPDRDCYGTGTRWTNGPLIKLGPFSQSTELERSFNIAWPRIKINLKQYRLWLLWFIESTLVARRPIQWQKHKYWSHSIFFYYSCWFESQSFMEPEPWTSFQKNRCQRPVVLNVIVVWNVSLFVHSSTSSIKTIRTLWWCMKVVLSLCRIRASRICFECSVEIKLTNKQKKTQPRSPRSYTQYNDELWS